MSNHPKPNTFPLHPKPPKPNAERNIKPQGGPPMTQTDFRFTKNKTSQNNGDAKK